MKALAQLVLGAALAITGVAVGWWIRAPDAKARGGVNPTVDSLDTAAIVEELRAVRAALERSANVRGELSPPGANSRVAAGPALADDAVETALGRLLTRIEARDSDPRRTVTETLELRDVPRAEVVLEEWRALASNETSAPSPAIAAFRERIASQLRLASVQDVVTRLGPPTRIVKVEPCGIRVLYSRKDGARTLSFYVDVVDGLVVDADVQ